MSDSGNDDGLPESPEEWQENTEERTEEVKDKIRIVFEKRFEIPQDSPAADPRLWGGVLIIVLLITLVWVFGPTVVQALGPT